jgi:hypothetical protein
MIDLRIELIAPIIISERLQEAGAARAAALAERTRRGAGGGCRS